MEESINNNDNNNNNEFDGLKEQAEEALQSVISTSFSQS
jgi:hypothetical protein